MTELYVKNQQHSSIKHTRFAQRLTTKKRTLTSRAIMWLGQTCNLRCFFCYFLDRIEDPSHVEHQFMTLEKAKTICRTLREFYGCTSIDIEGGEPTIYPHILELIAYCRDIGLYPTLITNCLILAKPGQLEKFRDAGIRDFLCSLHGVGEVHDEVVRCQGAYDKVIRSFERMNELNIPFRINCTMSKPVVPTIPDVARIAIRYGARVVNYIAFNAFEDQLNSKRMTENAARYPDLRPKLTEAIDMLEEAGIECNVRYVPICFAEERHRKNFYNFQQLPYDHHEWDYQSWRWTEHQPQRMKEGPLSPPYLIEKSYYEKTKDMVNRLRDRRQNAPQHLCYLVRIGYACIEKLINFYKQIKNTRFYVASVGKVGRWLYRIEYKVQRNEVLYRKEANVKRERFYKFDTKCSLCSLRKICDGFHADYCQLYGSMEAEPILDHSVIDDPLYYIKHQEKMVEEEAQ